MREALNPPDFLLPEVKEKWFGVGLGFRVQGFRFGIRDFGSGLD